MKIDLDDYFDTPPISVLTAACVMVICFPLMHMWIAWEWYWRAARFSALGLFILVAVHAVALPLYLKSKTGRE